MKKFILSTFWGLFSLHFALVGYSQPPNGLPENARVELKGTLQVFIRENLEEQTAEYDYFLERGKGKGPVKLMFLGAHPSELRSGMGIAIRGQVRNGNVEVTAANIEEGAGSSGTESGPGAAFTLDERRALVVIVNVSDVSHTPTDLENMTNYYFGSSNSMADMYKQISFGQLLINGEVLDPINVSQTANEVCINPFIYAGEWLTQAEAAYGINRNDYRHRIFAVPRNLSGPDCGWTGYANVGCGTACSAFNRWSHDINTTSHELGHNLQFAHSGVGTNQYADMSSFMGYSTTSGVRALDGAHHWQAGWYESIDTLSSDTIQSSGTYDIAPLAEGAPSNSAPSIYRIEIAGEDDYFLSARVAQGYDSGLNTLNNAALNGLNIHRYAGSGYDQTLRVAQLGDGGFYTDATNNITITQVSRANDGTVTFTVDMGEGECVASSPGLSMNTTFQTVGPGESYDFPVTLTNNDSAFCSPRTFSLSTTPGLLSPDSVTNLAPGTQGDSTLTLTGGDTGEIVADVSVNDEQGTSSVRAILTVDSTAPTIDALSGTYERKGKNHRVQLSWSGRDDSGIDRFEIIRGTTDVGVTSQTSYTDSLPRSPDPVYEYTVWAYDVNGNSDFTTISVSTTGGNDGDDGGGGNDKPCRGKKCNP